jgi:hypothetical protein
MPSSLRAIQLKEKGQEMLPSRSEYDKKRIELKILEKFIRGEIQFLQRELSEIREEMRKLNEEG